MGRWQRVGVVALALALAGPVSAPWQPARAAGAAEVSSLSTDLADMLVILSGTAAVFDSGRIQAALHDPQPFLSPDSHKLDVLQVKSLLKAAGFRPWTQRPTVWVVQPETEGSALTVLSADPHMLTEARTRGLPLSEAHATDSDAHAIAALGQGGELPALPGLLAAHQADALVIVTRAGTGVRWQFLQPSQHLEGVMTADTDVRAVLPHVLCEALAGRYQWPEAYGRPLVRVKDVNSLSDFAAVQTSLTQLNGVHGVSAVRVDGGTAYFAVDPMSRSALATALDTDPRLAPDSEHPGALSPVVAQARELGSPVQARVWHAAAAPGNAPARLQ